MQEVKLTDGTVCKIHFRHQYPDKYDGPQAKRHAVHVVTTCILVLDFVAVGVSLCAAGDQFSRKVGRRRAFDRALKNIKKDETVADLQQWFTSKWPEKARKVGPNTLTPEERQARIDAGAAKREQRRKQQEGATS